VKSTSRPSDIGPWGLIKAEIIDKYLKAFLQILNAQPWCKGTIYVDAFAGSAESVVRGTGELVPGSAKRALALSPGFSEYHFIDLDEVKARELAALASGEDGTFVYHGDGNQVLTSFILPRLVYESYWRGVVLLDPYGMDLDWSVVQALGLSESADVIINFPTMDMNRNALRKDASRIELDAAARKVRWWGDESWQTEFYSLDPQTRFWDIQPMVKVADNDSVVRAYCERLKSKAGFKHVTEPFPVKNGTNAILYYLLLASQKAPAVKIMNQIAKKYT